MILLIIRRKTVKYEEKKNQYFYIRTAVNLHIARIWSNIIGTHENVWFRVIVTNQMIGHGRDSVVHGVF